MNRRTLSCVMISVFCSGVSFFVAFNLSKGYADAAIVQYEKFHQAMLSYQYRKERYQKSNDPQDLKELRGVQDALKEIDPVRYKLYVPIPD